MDYLNNITYIGLMGPAGSGKTTTANILAPAGMLPLGENITTLYQHYTLAAPIYDIVGAKRNTEGRDSQSRIMYQLHDILYDLIGSSVDYDTLVETVYDVYAADAGTRDEAKPRTFMQWVGDVCRSHDADCFVDNMLRRARRDYTQTQRDLVEAGLDDDFLMLAFVSDVRRMNEIDKIKAQPRSILVRLEAPMDVLNDRIVDRDGRPMTADQWGHATEQEANQIDPALLDVVIDTSNVTPAQQANMVNDFIKGCLGVELSNPIEKVRLKR